MTAQLHDEVERTVTEEQKRLLAVGMEDTTTQANVTVTVYVSESFRLFLLFRLTKAVFPKVLSADH